MSNESRRYVRDHLRVVSREDLAELGETVSVLCDPEAMADIREAHLAYRRDEVVRGVEAVRALCEFTP